jgi:arylsulfatase A-like enzyme
VLISAGYRTWLRDLPLFNPPATQETATAKQPNIVLITAGGLRPDHLGISGYDPEISPNIDALAWQGARFEQAISPASWTEPSLASLLTGLYPSELGIACRAGLECYPHLDEARVTVAEAVKERSYRTQAFLTSPWLSAELGFAQGFDGFESNRPEEPFDLGPMRARTLGRLLGCDGGGGACQLLTQAHELLFQPPIAYGWGGGQINDRATRFLDLHGDERFFLWLHYTEALPAYDLEPPFRPIPEDSMASPQRSLQKMGYWELGDPFTPRETLLPKDVDGLLSLYDGEVHRLDRMVGEFVVQLRERGLADRTLVVFTADHGQEFMEHGGYTYGHSLYGEVLRVPLILAGPGVASPGGRTIETAVSTLDLAPTLAEIAGASVLPESGGRSLISALKGDTLEAVPVYSESLYRVPHESKTLYRDGYKLIHNLHDGSFELFELASDPAEQQDVLARYPLVAEAMVDMLLAWIAHLEQRAEELPRAAPPAQYDAWSW